MLNLLEKIWNKKILSNESTALLLNTMKECNTGNSRIKGLLPDKNIVYHKTGTIGDVTNDVGIIKLPEDFGNLAVVVFMKNAKKDTKDCERIIAQISRFLYDYFIFYTS
jgi:beta-lactamase class A